MDAPLSRADRTDPITTDVGLTLVPIDEVRVELAQLPEWRLGADGKRIARDYLFPDYREAIEFTLKAARLFHTEGHYPVVRIDHGCVTVECYTPFVDGVTDNDLAIASRLDTVHFVHVATAAREPMPEFDPTPGGCRGG